MTEAKGQPVTREMIVAGLRELGVAAGDLVQVHSSLSAFGYVAGGAETVVEALLEAVGPSGTVMVPTFNHGAADVFDVHTTPSVSGVITEALWHRPEAYRSVHPTHPLAAIGPLAELLTRGHLAAGTFGLQSPFGKLAAMGGKVLLLGVGMNVNTMAHLGEALYGVPCFVEGWPRRIRDDQGQVVPAVGLYWREGKCRVEWAPLEDALRQQGQIADGRIGRAEAHLMLGAHVLGATVRLCQELCPDCPVRPRIVE